MPGYAPRPIMPNAAAQKVLSAYGLPLGPPDQVAGALFAPPDPTRFNPALGPDPAALSAELAKRAAVQGPEITQAQGIRPVPTGPQALGPPPGAAPPLPSNPNLDPAQIPPKALPQPAGDTLTGAIGEGLYGVPVAGPALLGGAERLGAAGQAVMGKQPYSKALEDIQTKQEMFRKNNPQISGSSQMAGSAAMLPAFGGGVGAQVVGNAALAGADAMAREQDPTLAAAVGGGVAGALHIPAAMGAMAAKSAGKAATKAAQDLLHAPGQLPTSVGFVSPNTGSMKIQEAVSSLDSGRHQLLNEAIQDTHTKLGIKAHTSPVVGAWADGAENSAMISFGGGNDPVKERVALAMAGHIANQKSVLHFVPSEAGTDTLVRFVMPGNAQKAHKRLIDSGIAFHTLRPSGKGTEVFVLAQDQDTINKIRGVTNAPTFVTGNGEFIGTQLGDDAGDAAQRADAKRVYEETIGNSGGLDQGHFWPEHRDHWGSRLSQSENQKVGFTAPTDREMQPVAKITIPGKGEALITSPASLREELRALSGGRPSPHGTVRVGVADKIDPLEGRFSQRFPSGATRTEDPRYQHDLTLGREDVVALPGNMDRLRGYDRTKETQAQAMRKPYRGYVGLRHVLDPSVNASDQEIADEYVRFGRDNLGAVHDRIVATKEGRARGAQSQTWYDGSHDIRDIWAHEYELPPLSTGVAIAVLSPQKDWYQNASLAERAIRIITGREKGSLGAYTEDMHRRLQQIDSMNKYDGVTMNVRKKANPEPYPNYAGAIQGKRLDQLTDPYERAMWIRLFDETYNTRRHRLIHPSGKFMDFSPDAVGWGSLDQIAKADAAIRSGGDPALLSEILGEAHKVRFFANDINVPNDRQMRGATIDTHMGAALHLQPFSGESREVADILGAKGSKVTGTKGTYGLGLDATREAADMRGLMPRQLQSMTWEEIRAMFSAEQKRDETFVRNMRGIWEMRDAGRYNEDAARGAVFRAVGDTPRASWDQPNVKLYDPAEVSTYADNIRGPQLVRTKATGGDRLQRSSDLDSTTGGIGHNSRGTPSNEPELVAKPRKKLTRTVAALGAAGLAGASTIGTHDQAQASEAEAKSKLPPPSPGMTWFIVTGDDGHDYEVEGTNEADAVQTFEASGMGKKVNLDPAQLPPRDMPQSAGETLTGAAGSALYGIPVVGPTLEKAGSALGAAGRYLTGKQPFGEAYEDIQTKQEQFRKNNPRLSESAGVAGSTAATMGLGGTATGGRLLGVTGRNMLTRTAAGGASGATIGAADAAARGGDPKTGAIVGGVAGTAAPAVGNFAGRVTRELFGGRNIAAPSLDELGTSARNAFGVVDSTGAILNKKKVNDMLDDIVDIATRERLRKSAHPKSRSAFNELLDTRFTNPTLTELHDLRRMLGGAATTLEPDDRRVAGLMLEKLDEHIDSLTPADVTGPDPRAAVAAMRQGIDEWRRMRKGEQIQQIFEKARNAVGANYSMAGMQTAVRQKFRALADNPKQFRRFNPDEKAAILAVVRGGPIENGLRLLGRFAPKSAITIWPTIAASSVDLGLGAAVGVGAFGAKAGSSLMGMRNARMADRMIRAGNAGTQSRLPNIVRRGVTAGTLAAPLSLYPPSGSQGGGGY